MLIGLAGPAANFILAFVLMLFYYGFINEVPSVQVKTTAVEWVTPGSAAAQAGLQTRRHDHAVLKRRTIPTGNKIYERAKLNAGQTVPVTVERGGKTLDLTLDACPPTAKDDDLT